MVTIEQCFYIPQMRWIMPNFDEFSLGQWDVPFPNLQIYEWEFQWNVYIWTIRCPNLVKWLWQILILFLFYFLFCFLFVFKMASIFLSLSGFVSADESFFWIIFQVRKKSHFWAEKIGRKRHKRRFFGLRRKKISDVAVGQCNQMWRNFAIWATFLCFGKKLRLIHSMAKFWETLGKILTKSSGHTAVGLNRNLGSLELISRSS